MYSAIEQFRDNLLRARQLGELVESLRRIITPAIDLSDIWRAQMVLGVSALDHLIHEIARLGMIESSKANEAENRCVLEIPATTLTP